MNENEIWVIASEDENATLCNETDIEIFDAQLSELENDDEEGDDENEL